MTLRGLPPPLPCTNWTRLVLLPVLTGHVSSSRQASPRTATRASRCASRAPGCCRAGRSRSSCSSSRRARRSTATARPPRSRRARARGAPCPSRCCAAQAAPGRCSCARPRCVAWGSRCLGSPSRYYPLLPLPVSPLLPLPVSLLLPLPVSLLLPLPVSPLLPLPVSLLLPLPVSLLLPLPVSLLLPLPVSLLLPLPVSLLLPLPVSLLYTHSLPPGPRRGAGRRLSVTRPRGRARAVPVCSASAVSKRQRGPLCEGAMLARPPRPAPPRLHLSYSGRTPLTLQLFRARFRRSASSRASDASRSQSPSAG